MVYDNDHRFTSSPGVNPYFDKPNSGGEGANDEVDDLYARDMPTSGAR